MRFRFRLRTLLGLVALVALLIVVVPHWTPKATGFARGEAEAKQQIRRGHVTMYACGLMKERSPGYDASTGLPIQQIEGDIVSDYSLERIRGHNEFIRRWMAKGNAPPNSLREYDGLIRAPLTSLDGSSFIDLPIETPARIGSFRIAYSRTLRSGDGTHCIAVQGPAARWKHYEFLDDVERISVALLADDKILAIRIVNRGPSANGSERYERVALLDSYTGILLEVDSRISRASSQLDKAKGTKPQAERPGQRQDEL